MARLTGPCEEETTAVPLLELVYLITTEPLVLLTQFNQNTPVTRPNTSYCIKIKKNKIKHKNLI